LRALTDTQILGIKMKLIINIMDPSEVLA